ncbi:MAG TPA: hypothetical protein VHV51_09390 [Polyangiaceae bacterium]|nr:hypothetical protein [Polyangiaceae bacterium]
MAARFDVQITPKQWLFSQRHSERESRLQVQHGRAAIRRSNTGLIGARTVSVFDAKFEFEPRARIEAWQRPALST